MKHEFQGEKNMTKLERENELRQEYESFIKTEAGQKWKEDWQLRMGSDIAGDFGDYLYDFHTEMLM